MDQMRHIEKSVTGNSNNNNSSTIIYEETLNTIRSRYVHQRAIYTWCGIALVAVNPYHDLEIYGEQAVLTYHSASHQGYLQLDPHIYAVTEDAYTKLERDLRNQSIIVSGESGAGKTVSAKLAMKYFASIASSRAKIRIENRVLASNPIMEAIGNARTVRNDNSSRFGKYIQIYFDKQNRKMNGANMRTYLLEKSRVTKQQYGERNFHIFYQLLKHARQNPQATSHLKLVNSQSSMPFKYLGGIEPSDSEDDLRKFQEAFKTLDLDDKKCDIVYKVIAGILHGGNIKFESSDVDDSCKLNASEFHLNTCCELLGFKVTEIVDKLTNQKIQVRSDVIIKPLSVSFAEYGRDAMFKALYDSLFIYLVSLINLSLGGARNREFGDETPNLKSPSVKRTTTTTNILDSPAVLTADEPLFIGVLDIYGFENFDTNSFEQFCINYANEVLQQQFNQRVFKLEQEEYIREGIDWTFIEFNDNQPVIDIIESKPIGILQLLDEECRMPKGTDRTWCAKLHQQLKSIPDSSSIFKQPKFNYQTTFTISHYAEEVTYTVDTFLEKNRDTLWTNQMELLKESDVLREIFEESGTFVQTPNNDYAVTQSKVKTIAARFRVSLSSLMKTLNSTESHYIRCIKPNDEKKAFVFEDDRAAEQLRACGVYETIRISTNGFPSRWLYKDFAKRFSMLVVGTDLFEKLIESAPEKSSRQTSNSFYLLKQLSSRDPRLVCEAICELVYTRGIFNDLLHTSELDYIEELKAKASNTATSSPVYQFGRTKIFFRSRQVGCLERVRSHKFRVFAITIQRHIRGWLARNLCKRLREELNRRLQEELAKRLREEENQRLREEEIEREAASFIQVDSLDEISSHELDTFAVTIQRHVRGWLARNSCKRLRDELSERKAASLIQTQWLRYSAKRKSNQYIVRIDNMYQAMVELMYAKIQPLVVEAVLEHDGLNSEDPFASLESKSQSEEKPLELLFFELDTIHELMVNHQIDRSIALLIYKQLFYLICAHCLNQLLLRQNLCNFHKAILIRYNLSCLEQWCREKQLWRWKEIVEQLDPITQATKLLQTRKTKEHIPTIVEMCSKLRPSQIIKILNMYTLSYEEQISDDFIRELEDYLYKSKPQQHEITLLENGNSEANNNNVPTINNNNNDPTSIDNNNNDLFMDTRKSFTLSNNSQLPIRS